MIRRLVPFLFFAVFLGVVFGPGWLPGRTLFARDLTYVFHPMHVFTAENLQAGRLPLWNPYTAGGVPWMGDPQTGVFYPGNIFFWIFPFTAGLTFFHLLHALLAAAGAWLLARSMGGRRAGALAVALAASLNGFIVSRQEFTSLAGTLAWLPLLALLARGRSAWLASGLAASFFAGHTPHFLWTGLLVSVWAGPSRRLVLAGLAALGLAAVQGGVTAWAVAGADRFTGLVADAGLHALRPAQWLGAIWPWASGFSETAYPGEKFFWLGCFYVGMGGVALALLGIGRLSVPRRIGVLAVMSAGLILSLGERTPLFPWLHGHLLKGLRYPGQYLWLVTGGAVLLAAAAAARRLPRGVWTALALAGGAELAFYGGGFAPTLPTGYFHRRPDWIAPLQEGGAWLLSPRAASSTQGTGKTVEAAWMDVRLRLFNLANVPYHVEGLNPTGFGFVPREKSRALAGVYGAAGVAEALPSFRALGGRWMSLPAPVQHPDLRPAREAPWYLYEDVKYVPRSRSKAPRVPFTGGAALSVFFWGVFMGALLHRLKKFL